MVRKQRDEEISRLEMMVKALSEELNSLRANPPSVPFEPCSSGCIIAKFDGGMSTNGGCQCVHNLLRLRRAVMYWRLYAAHCHVVIEEIRNDDVQKS